MLGTGDSSKGKKFPAKWRADAVCSLRGKETSGIIEEEALEEETNGMREERRANRIGSSPRKAHGRKRGQGTLSYASGVGKRDSRGSLEVKADT